MKLIILDRDGVINEDSDHYIKSPEEFNPVPGSVDAIAMLTKAGYNVAIATNQSGLFRGLFTRETLDQMHQKLLGLLEPAGGKIYHIELCPHGPDEGCDCRKPAPGMLKKIQGVAGLDDLSGVFFVGDTLKDVQAARAAGASPLLVRTGKGERTLAKKYDELKGVPVFDNLLQATRWVLENDGSN